MEDGLGHVWDEALLVLDEMKVWKEVDLAGRSKMQKEGCIGQDKRGGVAF